MSTKTKALMKLIFVVLMIPIHLCLCLIGAGFLVGILIVIGIGMGWVGSDIWNNFTQFNVASYSVETIVFTVFWLALAALFFGRVNRKWL